MSYMALLMFENRYHELYVPNVNNESVSLRISPVSSGLSKDIVISLDVWDQVWYILENETIKIADKSGRLKSSEVKKGLIINATVHGSKEVFSISFSEINEGNIRFNKYFLNQTDITIGSGQNNKIRFKENVISPNHGVIKTNQEGFSTITDLGSVNGTFLNGKLIGQEEKLKFGDIIYIIGLKIVYLGSFIAINNPNGNCTMTDMKLIDIIDDDSKKVKSNDVEDAYYLRTPRSLTVLNQEEVEIEDCPAANKQKRQPIMFTIGPAFTMVIPMAMGAALSTGGGFGAAGLTMSIGAAVVGTFWALVNVNYAKKEEINEASKRSHDYKTYLTEVVTELETKKANNRNVLQSMYPKSEEFLGWLREGSRRLWEKSANHEDFLSVRLGTGQIPNPNPIIIPKRGIGGTKDSFRQEVDRIATTYAYLEDAPITLSLKENQLVGVISSNRKNVMNIARQLSIQVASAHPYTDVRMSYVYNARETEGWSFAKWLPHTWAPDGKLRLNANDTNTVGTVMYYLMSVLRDRQDKQKGDEKKVTIPHYLLFLGDPELVVGEAIEKFIYSPTEEMGITTILFVDSIDKLPSNCTTIIVDQDDRKAIYSLTNKFHNQENVLFEDFNFGKMNWSARLLSNIRIREPLTSQAIPEMLSFLDMYQTSKIEDIDVYKRWLKNRTYESMKSLIGYKGGDQPLYLDIHEKYHGPHGLVAGTTGSGKSETLQSYILSLAINYHPYEVSFILIDYKGGGMAASFDGLPHLAGIITNLGGNQTNRALASINSEIRRRQTVFSEYKVKHIDSYIELFRNGQAQEPMPHLLIIADEFAELKKEQPDFVRALVSAARVGRSLGVHLILATQKPSGVVDDEIWGNTRFRLCLRVADKQDSNEMIKRPDAAFITGSGRAFFQVGHDEIFEEFQSGWSGAAYEPEVPYSDDKNSKVEMINLIGKPRVLKGKKKKSSGATVSQKRITQLEAIVAYTNRLARVKKIQPIRQIWMQPLPSRLYFGDLEGCSDNYWNDFGWQSESFNIQPVIGLADDPVHQSQFPVKIDFLQEGHVMICGSAGSGKTTLLQTLIYSLVEMYSPEWVNLYIIDFNSRTMGLFANLPHVGSVTFEGEDEKIEQTLGFIQKELNRRKQLFSEKTIGSFKEYVRLYQDVNGIILIVDNYIAFADAFGEYEEVFVQLTREAASYGIYVVLTCTNPSDIRMKIRQNIRFGIGLQLADRFEYEEAIGSRTEIIAEAKTPGRGIIKAPNPVEFQSALCVRGDDALQINQLLRGQFEEMKNSGSKVAAKSIEQGVKKINYREFSVREDVATLPENQLAAFIEVENNLLVHIDLDKTFCYTIGGSGKTGKTNLLKSLGLQVAAKDADLYIFDGIERELEVYAQEIGAKRYLTNPDELFDFMQDILVHEFKTRNPLVSDAKEQDKDPVDFLVNHRRIILLINDMSAFCKAIYHSDKDMAGFMELALVKGLGHKINLFAGISSRDYDDYLTYSTMRSFISTRQGVHLGGLFDQQNIFEFELAPQDRSRKYSPGIGAIDVNGKTKKIITPLIEA